MRKLGREGLVVSVHVGFEEATSLVLEHGMISVLNRRFHGIPDGAAYIGRGSRWGNPFRIGPDGSRDDVIAKYAAWYSTSGLDAVLHEIRGKNLVCWCAPQRCHGHFLLARANYECHGGYPGIGRR